LKDEQEDENDDEEAVRGKWDEKRKTIFQWKNKTLFNIQQPFIKLYVL
jgi:hypothetical protein